MSRALLVPLRLLCSLLVMASAAAALSAADAPVAIGSRREIFVDRHLIQSLDGAELRLATPRPSGAVLKLDRPWEGILSGYFTVLKDGDKYRMYYRGYPQRPDGKQVACYAESDDGISWVRPSLGLFELYGSRDNNVILADAGDETHNFAPVVDTRPGVPAEERYKAVGGSQRSGLIAYASGDGVRWRKLRAEPIITEGAFDSQNNVFWSTSERRYVCYFRTFKNRVRWITRTTSTNFLDWTPPIDAVYGDTPSEHLYTNQMAPYFRAPHIYIGTAARYFPRRWALTPEVEERIALSDPRNYDAGERLRGGISDAVLLSSRGGQLIDRTFLESYVRAGVSPRDWVARSNYPARGVVPTGDGEMSIYVQRHYGQPSHYVERLTLRLDGFASIHAGYRGGELTTKPITFEGGELAINFASSAAGGVRVELQDADGKAHPGFALDGADELIGDSLERKVTWQGKGDVSGLAGKPVRLRFVLKDADLYAFRFRPRG